MEEVQARRRDRDRLIGAPMPCLPDGFQLCRTICQALPRPRSFHIGLAGPPSGRRPIRDINTTTDPNQFSLSVSSALASLSILGSVCSASDVSRFSWPGSDASAHGYIGSAVNHLIWTFFTARRGSRGLNEFSYRRFSCL